MKTSKFKVECIVEIFNKTIVNDVTVATVSFTTATNQKITFSYLDDTTASGEMVIKELIAMKHKKRG